MAAITILLADKQELISEGLKRLIESKQDLRLCGEINSADNFIESIRLHAPDLLITDYHQKGFIEKEDLEKLAEISPNTKVLVISSDSDKTNIHQVLSYGVKGYLTKECSRREILEAIYAIANNEKFFCNKVLDIILEKYTTPEEVSCEPTSLSDREEQVVGLVAQGLSTKSIAERLCLSPHTINTHRKNINKKLGIKSPAELIIFAVNNGLIKA